MMYTNLFYFHTLNSIGGIETFFWQLGKKYGKKYDITLFYRTGDANQVRRLSEYIRVKKYHEGQKIRAKRAFLCFNTDIVDNIIADEYWQMLHGDYVSLGVYPMEHPNITKWIAVSEVVKNAYMTGKDRDSIVCYNPYTVEKPKRVLRLISATRLTPDKGFHRMETLADALDAAGIPFEWMVYSDSQRRFKNPNIIIRPPRLDILNFVANSDYYVQLSDAEGYCYSVVEALSVGTPVIVTDFKVAREIGIKDGENGFILPMDMSKIPVDKIYKKLKKVQYKPLPDSWADLLLPGKDEDYEDPNKMVKVRCKRVYLDLEFHREMKFGEEWEVPMKRADQLYDLGLVDLVD